MNDEIHRGLKGVYFDRSRVCYSYLLFHGELPTREQLDAFSSELKAARKLPAEIYRAEVLQLLARDGFDERRVGLWLRITQRQGYNLAAKSILPGNRILL